MFAVALFAVLFCLVPVAEAGFPTFNVTEESDSRILFRVYMLTQSQNATEVTEYYCLDSPNGAIVPCTGLVFTAPPGEYALGTWTGLEAGTSYVVYVNRTLIKPKDDPLTAGAEQQFCTAPHEPDSVTAVMGSSPTEIVITVQHTVGNYAGFYLYVMKHDGSNFVFVNEYKMDGNLSTTITVMDYGSVFMFDVYTYDQCEKANSTLNVTSGTYMTGLATPTMNLTLIYNSDMDEGMMCFFWQHTFLAMEDDLFVVVKLMQGASQVGIRADKVDAAETHGVICVDGDNADLTMDTTAQFYTYANRTGFSGVSATSASVDATHTFSGGAAMDGPNLNCTSNEMGSNCTVDFTFDETDITTFTASSYATVNWTVSGGDGGSVQMDFSDNTYCGKSGSIYTCKFVESGFNVSSTYTFNFHFCMEPDKCMEELIIGTYNPGPKSSDARHLVAFGGTTLLAMVLATLFRQ